MRNTRTTIALLIGTLILSGCETMPKAMESVTNSFNEVVGNNALTAGKMEHTSLSVIPKQYETSMLSDGENADLLRYEAETGLLPKDGELQTYLNSLLSKIVAQSGVQGYNGKVYVLTDPRNYDVVASVEGNIFVPIGFLSLIPNEDAIAFVLAHEFAHHVYSHFSVDIVSKSQKAVSGVYKNLARYSNQAQQLMGVVPGAAGKMEISNSQQLSNLSKAAYLIEKTDTYLLPLWQTVQEQQADLLAMDLAMGLGYNFDATLSWMPAMEKQKKQQLEVRKAEFEVKRQQVLKDAANQPSSGNLKTDALTGLQNFGGTYIEEIMVGMQSTHAEFEKRRNLLTDYYGKFHTDKGFAPSKEAQWKKVWNNPKVSKMYKALDDSAEVPKLVKAGEKKRALSILNAAKQIVGNISAYPYVIEAELELANEVNLKQVNKSLQKAQTGKQKMRPGNKKFLTELTQYQDSLIEAKQSGKWKGPNENMGDENSGREPPGLAKKRPTFPDPLATSTTRLPNYNGVKRQLAMLENTGQTQERLKLAREVFESYGKAGFIYPTMIAAERDAGNVAIAERLNLECTLTYPTVAEECVEAVKGSAGFFDMLLKPGT